MIGMLILIASISGVSSLQELPPIPTTVQQLRECPHCHTLQNMVIGKDGEMGFINHDLIRLPITNEIFFETCSVVYFNTIGNVMISLAKNKLGRFVKLPKKLKK